MWRRWLTSHPHGKDQHFRKTKWLSGRRQKFVSTQTQFLCLGKVEHDQGTANANWTRQIEDLKWYFSYQDAVGLDGEPIEFEWRKTHRICNTCFSHGDPEGKEEKRAGEFQRPGHLCVNVRRHWVKKEWWELHFECRADKNDSNKFLPGLFWVQFRKRSGKVTHFMGNGFIQSTKWYSNSEKLVVLFPQLPVLWVAEFWNKGKAEVPFTSMESSWTQNCYFK